MTKTPKNIAASVRARLLNFAKERGDDFQLVLTRYANERLLHRLSVSPHGKRFVLKGATLFTLWTGHSHRATRDIDLLGFGDPSEKFIRRVFDEVLELDVSDDGVLFDKTSLVVGPIREDQAYGGIRVVVVAGIASAEVRVQIDVGFGDVITPEASEEDLPVLLDFPAPRIRVYPKETVVAEKLEAMVQLGIANSRMKDFYDLTVISRLFDFSGSLLVSAIRATFERRNTPLPTGLPVALTSTFSDDPIKNTQWTAFKRKAGINDVGDLQSAITMITSYAARPLEVAVTDETWKSHWPPHGPWEE
ncbi:MAG: nucleotidyl transferase AbiEii/AbiGii toxin family protein [Proteobacteria bacterium]|nr:nucleotidyl transferase AbiEii/AbiGii toxin family protein [Pseudomonadota bacterium]